MTDPTTDTPTDSPAPESTLEAAREAAPVALADIPDPTAESRETLNALIAQSGLSRTEWCNN